MAIRGGKGGEKMEIKGGKIKEKSWKMRKRTWKKGNKRRKMRGEKKIKLF